MTNKSNSTVRYFNETYLLFPDTIYILCGVILVIILTLGFLQNTLTIYVFIKEKFLRKSHNIFIVGLAISDVSMCIFGVWMVLVAAVYKRWIFGRAGCVYYGFTTTLLGITQISLLANIAVDRYLVIAQPSCLKPTSMRRAVTVVLCCYCYGLLWAIFPAFGWSSYELEGMQLRCAVNWRSKKPSDLSYAMTILVLAWMAPLSAIVYCCRRICVLIHHDAKKPLRRRRSFGNMTKSRNREKRAAITVVLMIGAFVLSWTPYSIVTLIVMFGNPDDVPLSVTMVPALFAKSSILWNPIIYVARHREYRRACLKQLPAVSCMINHFGLRLRKLSNSEITTTGLHGSVIKYKQRSFTKEAVNIVHSGRCSRCIVDLPITQPVPV